MLTSTTLSVRDHEDIDAETIEQEACIDLARSIPEPIRTALAVTTGHGEGTAFVTARVRSYVLNRGWIGVGGPASHSAVRDLVSRLRQSGTFLLHVAPRARPSDVEAWIVEAGVERYPRSWWKLGARLPIPLGALPPSSSTVVEQAEAWSAPLERGLSALAREFGLEGDGRIFAGLVGRPRWRVYYARVRGEIAGVGLSFMSSGTAYLCGAMTLPEHRRRGVQTALLGRRIEEAQRAGCRAVVSETGEDLPGEPLGSSLRNLQRAGLERLYLRPNYAAPKTTRFQG